jgi:LPXTG-motif cell wall-anchored protein
VAGDFDFYVTPVGAATMGPYSSGDLVTLEPGDYVVSETPIDGYTAGDWGGDCAADGSITLEEGDEAECTITNDDTPEEATTTTVLPPEEPTTTTTSTTQAPGTTAAPTTTEPTEEPTELPSTGAGSFLVLMLAGLGMATLGAGLVLLGTSRRRQAWVF